MTVETMKLSLGETHLLYDSGFLSIARDKDGVKFELDTQRAEELIDFLSSIGSVEFNRRQAFRIPVANANRIEATLEYQGESHAVQAINISFTGMFITFNEKEWLSLPPDAPVHVDLKLGRFDESLEAVVRRAEGYGYGLSFPSTTAEEHICPPENLRAIVMETQRLWLANRFPKS